MAFGEIFSNELRRYPQQLGRLGRFLAICLGAFRNFINHLHRNPPELNQPSAPKPSGTSSVFCYLHRNCPEPHQLSAPEFYRTSSTICAGTLRNLINHLHWNPPEPHQPSAPKPSGTSSVFCYLHRNRPEPYQFFCPGALRNSSAICSGTVPNLSNFLQQNFPKLSAICPRTFQNLLRNPVLQLHGVAPEPFGAKDPIASVAFGEKYSIVVHSANNPGETGEAVACDANLWYVWHVKHRSC